MISYSVKISFSLEKQSLTVLLKNLALRFNFFFPNATEQKKKKLLDDSDESDHEGSELEGALIPSK